MRGIADTGFIVAFGNRAHRYHSWAVDLAHNITEPLLTCEAVLAEAAFHLGSSSYVFALLEDEMLRIAFECNRHLDKLKELAIRYRDRNPDVADLCVVRMSEMYLKHAVSPWIKPTFGFTGEICGEHSDHLSATLKVSREAARLA